MKNSIKKITLVSGVIGGLIVAGVMLVSPLDRMTRQIKTLCGVVDPDDIELSVAYGVAIKRQLDYLMGDGYDSEDKLTKNEAKEKILWVWASELAEGEARRHYLQELSSYQETINKERAYGEEVRRVRAEKTKRIDDLADCLPQPPMVR